MGKGAIRANNSLPTDLPSALTFPQGPCRNFDNQKGPSYSLIFEQVLLVFFTHLQSASPLSQERYHPSQRKYDVFVSDPMQYLDLAVNCWNPITYSSKMILVFASLNRKYFLPFTENGFGNHVTLEFFERTFVTNAIRYSVFFFVASTNKALSVSEDPIRNWRSSALVAFTSIQYTFLFCRISKS